MKIGHTNHIDDAATLLTAGSEISTHPVEHIGDVHLSKQWRTNASNSSHFVADQGAAKSFESLFVGGTNLTSVATMRIRVSTTDATGAAGDVLDTGSISAAIDNDYGTIAYFPAAAASGRYFRLDLADTSLSDLQIGRVHAGLLWTPARNHQFPLDISWEDPSTRTRSKGGQIHIDERSKFRVIEFVLGFLSETQMMANAFDIDRVHGSSKEVLIVPDPASTYLSETAIWGLMDTTRITNAGLNVWRKRYRVEERL